MKKHIRALGAAVLLLAVTAGAQTPPTPAHQRLSYFVGHWKTEGVVHAGPFSPGGAFSSDDHAEWMDGEFFVVTRAASTTPQGRQFQLSVLGYDAQQQVYTFSAFNNAGVRTTATGTVDGDTWTWVSADTIGGQTIRLRHTITMASPSAYTFRFDLSTDGATWSTFIDGKTTKTD